MRSNESDRLFSTTEKSALELCAMPIVQTVESWYAENLDRLKTEWPTIRIRCNEPTDPVRGKVTIEAESDRVAAFVKFWNKGDVDVERMDLPVKRITVIDDRSLSPSEDICLLLDSYFRQILQHRDS